MTATNWNIIALVSLGIIYTVAFYAILRKKNDQEQAAPLMRLFGRCFDECYLRSTIFFDCVKSPETRR